MKVNEFVNENSPYMITRYVLYINNKPAAHYASGHEALDQMQAVLKSMKKNYPDLSPPSIEIKKEQIRSNM